MVGKVVEKAKAMDAEDWGNLTGQVGFEVLTEVATAGAGLVVTGMKAADRTVDVARAAEKVDDIADAAKTADKLEDTGDAVNVGRAAEKAEDASDAVRASEAVEEGEDAAKATDKAEDAADAAGPEKLGDVVYGGEAKFVKIGLFKRYIQSIENITDRKLHPKQVERIKEALRNKKYEKLSPSENLKKRKEFNRKRNSLISEWEQETGQTWPKYDEVILDKNGKPYRNVGDNYDAHHVIENNYGGNDEWWNMHPAKSPDEHQGGIHSSGSPSKEIFE